MDLIKWALLKTIMIDRYSRLNIKVTNAVSWEIFYFCSGLKQEVVTTIIQLVKAKSSRCAHRRIILPWIVARNRKSRIVARSRKSYLASCPIRLSWSAVITCSLNSVYTVRKSALSAWGNCITSWRVDKHTRRQSIL